MPNVHLLDLTPPAEEKGTGSGNIERKIGTRVYNAHGPRRTHHSAGLQWSFKSLYVNIIATYIRIYMYRAHELLVIVCSNDEEEEEMEEDEEDEEINCPRNEQWNRACLFILYLYT